MSLRQFKLGFYPKEGVWVAAGPLPRAKEKKEGTIPRKLSASAEEYLFTTPKPKNTDGHFLKRFDPMKKFLIPLAFLAVCLAIFTAAYFWWNKNSKSVSAEEGPKDFLVVRGKSASQIGEALYRQGLIKSPLAFKIYVQVSGKAAGILAGQFRISSSFSLVKVVDTLTKPPAELWITVPEGLRREEIVERFIKGLEVKETEATTFREEFFSESEGFEGFLFPDTYLFPRTASPSAIVKKMHSTFDAKVKEFEEDISSSGLSQKEVVTLASIIERETKTDEERPVVSGILLNRLNIDMGLQADATVQYAVASENCKANKIADSAIQNCPNWWPVLTRDDLSINSPFNTYKFRGLPPAPIANPGLSSLKAAINPETNEYLYYLHDSEGKIHYAKTLAEHNENVRKYLGK